MNESNRKQVRLTTFGFDARTEEGFRITFRGPGQGRAVIVDQDAADFGIINMDSAEAPALLAAYETKYPGRPAIKLSVREGQENDLFYVKKPASIEDMLAAVDRLVAELNSASVVDEKAAADEIKEAVADSSVQRAMNAVPSIQPAAAKGKSKAQVSLFYNPKDYLQSEVHSAVEYSKTREVAVELWVLVGKENWKKIIFLPNVDRVLTSLNDKELKFYCSSPLSLLDYKMYRRNEKETERLEGQTGADKRGISYESFLWKVALCTSQGRLPQGVSVRENAQLKHWPNLTRLYPIVGSMRIATLMIGQPRTLPVIAKALKMPAGRVFAFYSAAYAIGIAGAQGDNAPEFAKTSIPKRHRDHTLLGQIIKRLKKNDDPEVEAFV